MKRREPGRISKAIAQAFEAKAESIRKTVERLDLEEYQVGYSDGVRDGNPDHRRRIGELERDLARLLDVVEPMKANNSRLQHYAHVLAEARHTLDKGITETL